MRGAGFIGPHCRIHKIGPRFYDASRRRGPLFIQRSCHSLLGTMMLNKCEHGVYLPSWAVDGANPYCTGCDNFGKVPNPQNIILPKSSGDALTKAGRLSANKHEAARGCPECLSAVYTIENNPSERTCGDCGTRYKVRLTAHQRAEILRADIEEKCDE